MGVSDNGGGVPEEHEEHIFEIFHTTKEGGTGLGLSIVRRIVDEHGFEIALENRVGIGATFWIRMPKPKILTISEDE